MNPDRMIYKNRNEITKSKLVSLKTTIALHVTNSIKIIGSCVYKYPAMFILLPIVVTTVLSVLGPVFSDINAISPIDIKRSFLPINHESIRFLDFDKKWFSNTWARLGSSRYMAQAILKSKNDEDTLNDAAINDVLHFYKIVQKFKVNAGNGTNITYTDVCLKKGLSHWTKLLASNINTSVCDLDPLLEILLRSGTKGDVIFQLQVDKETKAACALLTPLNENQTKIKVFLGRSIGWISHNDVNVFSAQSFHLAFILQANTEDEKKLARLWLNNFEKVTSNFEADHLIALVSTTESINNTWLDIVELKSYQIALLCVIHFLMTLVYVIGQNIATWVGIFTCCIGTVSLLLTLMCVKATHYLIYNVPQFNFLQCAIFLTAFQSVFQLNYIRSHFKCNFEFSFQRKLFNEEKGSCQNVPIKFVESFKDTFLINLICSAVIWITFAAPLFPPNTPNSVVHMCLTCNIGIAFAFAWQISFVPGCTALFLHKANCLLLASHQSRDIERNNEVSEVSATDNENYDSGVTFQTTKSKKKVKGIEKMKSEIKEWTESYYNLIVTIYMRPISTLLYLTYISFCFVGCLVMKERITPLMLVDQNSAVYRINDEFVNGFDPFGTSFVVEGNFQGNPWDVDVQIALLKIHQTIDSHPNVNGKLSTNWLEEFIKRYETNTESTDFVIQDEDYSTNDVELLDQYGSNQPYMPDLLPPILQVIENPPSRQIKVNTDMPIEAMMNYWQNYTSSADFKNYFAEDIVYNSTGCEGKPCTAYRWFYYHSQRVITERLYANTQFSEPEFQAFIKNLNKSITPSLYFDAPEFDWSLSYEYRQFSYASVSLCVCIIVCCTLACLIVKKFFIPIWSVFFATSCTFGVSGLLTFSNIGLESFIFGCLLFAFPYSLTMIGHFLFIFYDSNQSGREFHVKQTLRLTTCQNLCSIFILLLSNLLLTINMSHVHRVPCLAIAFFVFIVTAHTFVFVPVFLTILPSHIKPKIKTPIQSIDSNVAESSNTLIDPRPHLHARRYYYDSQRAASFLSDEEDCKIEHITCL